VRNQKSEDFGVEKGGSEANAQVPKKKLNKESVFYKIPLAREPTKRKR